MYQCLRLLINVFGFQDSAKRFDLIICCDLYLFVVARQQPKLIKEKDKGWVEPIPQKK